MWNGARPGRPAPGSRAAGPPSSRAAGPAGAGQPGSRAAGQPSSRAAGQPSSRAAEQPGSRAAEQPGSRAAGAGQAGQPSSRRRAGRAWDGRPIAPRSKALAKAMAKARSKARAVYIQRLDSLDIGTGQGTTCPLSSLSSSILKLDKPGQTRPRAAF